MQAGPHLSWTSPLNGGLLHSLLSPSVAGTTSKWLTNSTGFSAGFLPCHLINRLNSATCAGVAMSEMCLVEQASIKLNVLFQLSSVSISTGKISASVHKLRIKDDIPER